MMSSLRVRALLPHRLGRVRERERERRSAIERRDEMPREAEEV